MILWFYLEQISKGIKIKCIDLMSERWPVDVWRGIFIEISSKSVRSRRKP